MNDQKDDKARDKILRNLLDMPPDPKKKTATRKVVKKKRRQK